ncbi:hypothetical protein FHX42_002122 [Saccharopolyspora lacisalsi]|uniref:DUF4158 domain-containing protein n=1 Tax=Halosaccharopolyspora lacisalsi TaxID=1000566 RepID=A0A839DZE5_9PSEU|nr:hypothetical protein [Halosaccharopolyspora lacisalsi]
MQREWASDELVESWTLAGDDWRLVGNKSGATRLGFALLLKFFEIEARFPRYAEEVPPQAVGYVAEQVGVDAEVFGHYSWRSRSIKEHRAQVRAAFGFREFSRGDEDKLAGWLADEVCPVELREDRLRQAVLVRCRADGIEPPGRLDRIIGSARSTFEQRFCQRTVERLPEACVAALEALVADEDSSRRGLLAELKADPGQVGLETVLAEIDKLTAVRQLGLPDGLFTDASEKLVAAWRARAMRSYPSDLRDSPREVRLTLLAALCWMRQSEITDALVDLLIRLVHKINTKADRKVEHELTDDLRRVRGKEGILFRMAETALEQPDEQVRTAVSGRRREDSAGAGQRGQGHRAGVSVSGAHGAAGLVFEPLSADVAAAVGRAGFSLQQHRLPADHAGFGAVAALSRCRWQGPLLRWRGVGAGRGSGAESLA